MSVTESSASVQSATEDRKLTRIRGGHKGAFTRLEQKVDEFTVTAIDSSTKLFQGEALLKTLQDRIAMIQGVNVYCYARQHFCFFFYYCLI